MSEDRSKIREQAYAALESAHGGPVAAFWRTAIGDTEALTCFGPGCPADHPDLGDGLGRDDTGVYDCCPPVVETFSVTLAAYLVSLLNRDAAMNPETSPCATALAHPAHDYTVGLGGFRVAYTCPGVRVKDVGYPA